MHEPGHPSGTGPEGVCRHHQRLDRTQLGLGDQQPRARSHPDCPGCQLVRWRFRHRTHHQGSGHCVRRCDHNQHANPAGSAHPPDLPDADGQGTGQQRLLRRVRFYQER
uniref:(northern house mosquito) hypothetical protein n=1 Tax=Culex pipiens TaxID=7175 RepID=A0A8D8E5S7_CULPI